MKFLELTYDDPATNLACDEALLEALEAGSSQAACLRVWESTRLFVVLGHSDSLNANVNVDACAEQDIPIVRRISGGGTVVQGPGCLNYSLILKNDVPGLSSVAGTFKYVLERHRALVEKICGVSARFEGSSDLTCDDLKFSGNAQYRKAGSILVHGTFLLSFDLALIEKLLPLPARQPAYRRSRPHLRFLTNLHAEPMRFREELKNAWDCGAAYGSAPVDRIERLLRDRYAKAEWVRKF
jgi:lipoate-protein ligase A